MKGAFTTAVVNGISELSNDKSLGKGDEWRILYAAVAIAPLLKERSHPILEKKLAISIANTMDDVFVRQEDDGALTWTIVLSLGERTTISIMALDDSAAAMIACLILATFVKVFERELSKDLLGGNPGINELTICVGDWQKAPDDLRLMGEEMKIAEALEEQSVAATRPVKFEDGAPTYVLLGNSFLDELTFGEGKGGSLQVLLGLVLVELTFQLLRGEVDADAIRPKVVSIVRRTLS
jgi:hypothetical protein